MTSAWNVREARDRNLRCCGGELEHILAWLRGSIAARHFRRFSWRREIVLDCLTHGGGFRYHCRLGQACFWRWRERRRRSLDRRLRSRNARRGLDRSFGRGRVPCGLRLQGQARILVGKLIRGGHDGERCQHDAHCQPGFKDETKTPHCKISQQAPTIHQEARTGKAASEVIN